MRASMPVSSVRTRPRYRVLGSVASGGMGSVLLALAEDPKGGTRPRPVALKQMHAHLAEDPRMIEMFVDEARLASRLSHPNIVRVNDVEMINDDVVLVMDFIEGVPLSSLLRKLRDDERPMPLPIARRIVHDVLLGLHAAHELRDPSGTSLGVIHRDVSPQNVLLGVDGIARITDFGVAKARGRLASTQADGSVKGKLQYLAPEQIYRKPLDRRVDVFSAGIVLWECLAGRKLFAGESEGETLARIINEPILPPSTDRFEVPLDLDETCLRALERDPKRRYATAQEFAAALEGGPLADRSELAALVCEAGAETIAAHRALLEGKKPTSSVVSGTDPSLTPFATTSEAPLRKRRSFVGVFIAVAVGAIAGGALTSYGVRTSSSATTAAVPAPEPAASSAGPAPAIIEFVESPPLAVVTPSGSAAPAPAPAKPSRPRSGARGPRGAKADAGAVVRQFEPEDL